MYEPNLTFEKLIHKDYHVEVHAAALNNELHISFQINNSLNFNESIPIKTRVAILLYVRSRINLLIVYAKHEKFKSVCCNPFTMDGNAKRRIKFIKAYGFKRCSDSAQYKINL